MTGASSSTSGSTASGPVRVALVGLGNSGWYYHAESNLLPSPDLDLVAVCDADPARAAAGGERFVARATTDWREVAAADDVELVVVALPHHLHREVVVGCLAAGRHVHVEKPMATSVTDAAAMLDAARAAGRQLSVHQQRRWEPDSVVIADLVRSGALGRVERVELARSHAGRYRTAGDAAPHVGDGVVGWTESAEQGGGVGWLIGPHPVDLLLQLVGAPVVSVRGERHPAPGQDVEDHLGVEVVFEGATGRVDVHRAATGPVVRCVVRGERGTLVSADGSRVVLRAGGRESVVADGLPPAGRLGSQLYASLVGSLRGGPPVAVTGEQGLAVVDVLERALRG